MRLVSLFLIVGTLAAADPLTFEREDGTKCVAYVDLPPEAPFSITLIIPGSQKESSLVIHDSLKEDLIGIGQGAITLEKRGAEDGEIDSSLSLRLEDHFFLVKKLKGRGIAGWDGRLSVLGQGDGGRIGAALAASLDSLDALILIASGGGWTPQQEALYSFRSELADGGYSPQYIQGFLVQAKQEFAEALKRPSPEKKAFGYNYKYWESLLKTNLAGDLSRLSCPIYTVNGALDERVPIESVEALAERMKDRITFRKKEKVGREILKDHRIYQEAISWLSLNKNEL